MKRDMRTNAAACTLAFTLVVASLAHTATARARCSAVECEKVRQKIAKIESKMRQGYKVSAGERMQDELRRLRKLRARVCR